VAGSLAVETKHIIAPEINEHHHVKNLVYIIFLHILTCILYLFNKFNFFKFLEKLGARIIEWRIVFKKYGASEECSVYPINAVLEG
jgi:hypothetical protein